MNFDELIRTRYSVRKYKQDKIEKEKLEKILEAGRLAPTGANKQGQRILVVREKSGLDKAAKAANVFNVPLVLIVCYDKNDVWVRPYDKKKLVDIDASIVTTHMMLQATELGLGSVWICWFEPTILRKEFNLPDNWEPINILAIGYTDEVPKPLNRFDSERKPIDQTVFYEEM